MKYRKKPVVIEAYQFVEGFCSNVDIPQEFRDAVLLRKFKEEPYIHTLEGDHNVKIGDWIVKGINGEFYPVKPDIFERTYERVR